MIDSEVSYILFQEPWQQTGTYIQDVNQSMGKPTLFIITMPIHSILVCSCFIFNSEFKFFICRKFSRMFNNVFHHVTRNYGNQNNSQTIFSSPAMINVSECNISFVGLSVSWSVHLSLSKQGVRCMEFVNNFLNDNTDLNKTDTGQELRSWCQGLPC